LHGATESAQRGLVKGGFRQLKVAREISGV